jgi:hypothetical protein
LATWVCAGLLGVIVGLALAKYAQAWSGLAAHPGAITGAVVVFLGVGLALAAAGRYRTRGGSRAIGILAALLVALPGWLALTIIAVAGWEWPPARPGG